METQSLSNKQAEVTYRTKLQQGAFTRQEPSGKILLSELKARLERTRRTFQELQKQGVQLSPFLEIGAERGQRAMLLASEFEADGIMLDLSLESLREAEALRHPLNLNVIPQRVCADTYNLPFPDNTFAFIFAFQTLHHFPNPTPIVNEVHRVLAPGGTFFFDEEPIRQTANLRLWRRPTKLRWWEKILKATLLLHFLSEIGKSEVDAGIIETAFNLPTWEKALNVFETAKATLTGFPFGPTEQLSKIGKGHWLNPSLPTRMLLKLLGGNIQAIGKKKGKQIPVKLPPFACPSCRTHPPLEKQERNWYCHSCSDTYPIKDGVPILIEKQLRQKLYGNSTIKQ